MRHPYLLALLFVGCAGGPDTPTSVPATAESRAALLAGEYALTITVDAACTQLPIRTWGYHGQCYGKHPFSLISTAR